MAITPPPTPPNTGDPAFLEQRADAFFGWFPTFVSQFNAELPTIRAKTWAARGGTANAITLTAGFVSLATGMQVRFRAAAANTGATTINLDGLGAKACRTITGVALPVGYIRTDADTVATYDGTIWVLERQIERGSNANGEYARCADGTQLCWASAVNFNYANANSLQYDWTYPASFSGTVIGHVAFPPASADYTAVAIGDIGIARYTASPTTGTYALSKVTGAPNISAGATVKNVRILASGRWY